MKSPVLIVFFGLVSCVASTYIQFDVCENPVFNPDSVSIRPKPVRIGAPLLVRVRGHINRAVATGTFEYKISYRIKTIFGDTYRTMYKDTEDLCKRASCPIIPGYVMLQYYKKLPPILPSGLYKITIKAKDSDGVLLMCIVAHMDFVQSSAITFS